MSDSILTKICSKCQIEKPVSEFYKQKSSKDGMQSYCKACYSEYRKLNKDKIAHNVKDYALNNKDAIDEYKKIYRINNKEKIAEYKKEYYKNNKDEISIKEKIYRESNKEIIDNRSRKYRETHKKQIAIANKKYYLANKETHKKQSHDYYVKNKDRMIKLSKEYKLKNKEHIDEWGKSYRASNKEKINKRIREYYKANPDKYKESRDSFRKSEKGRALKKKHNHKRRALKRNATIEDFSPIEIFERDGYRCQICNRKTGLRYKNPNHPLYTNLDHIIPLSKGGDHSRLNTQVLCHKCNNEKNNREDFGDQIRLF